MKQIFLKPEIKNIISCEENISLQLNTENPDKKYLAFSFNYDLSENKKPFLFYPLSELIKKSLQKIFKNEKIIDFFIQKISQVKIHNVLINEQEQKITIVLVFFKIITFGNIDNIKNLIKQYEQITQTIIFNQNPKNHYKYENLFEKAVIIQNPFSVQRLIEIALTMQQPIFKIQDGLIEVVNDKFYHNPSVKYVFKSDKHNTEDLLEKIQNKFKYILSEKILTQENLILEKFN